MVPLLLLPLLWGWGGQQPGYQYELRVQESVTVQEGLCVHVPCSFYPWDSWSSSSELYTYWYQHGDDTAYDAPVASNNPHKPVKSETENRFIFKDPKTNNCSLSIRDARRSDTGRYFFRVERGDSVKHSYREKMLNLQVTGKTDKPHIQILEPLVSSHPTQLACSLPGACERGQRFTFSWAGAAVDSLDPQTLHSFKLTFTPRPGDHGTNLTCQVQVQRPQLTTQRTIRLDVSCECWRGGWVHGGSGSNVRLSKPENTRAWILPCEVGPCLSLPDAPGNLTIGVSFRNATGRKEPLLSGAGTCPWRWWGREGSRSGSERRWGWGRGAVSWAGAGAVPAALGGAGATALLSLCLCLISFCIVKARRRQAAGRPKVTNDEDPVMGTVTLGSQKNLQPDGPPDQAPPAEKGPLSGEQQELYYANLTFEGLKPREPRGQEATSTQERNDKLHR
uniref:Ig-like domain-containing protein n=1 Tax=Myotis lucifugus TaxID=59463 RepID=G1Q934_MYOLU